MYKKFLYFIPLIFSLYSCSVGVKGSFLTYVSIGTNSNQFSIYLPQVATNKIFSSFQELLSSDIDQKFKNFFDDSFFLLFYPISKEVILFNQLPKKINLLSSSEGNTYLLDSLNFENVNFIQDVVFNSDYSAMILFFNSISSQEDSIYSLGFYKKGSQKIEYIDYLFTNVVKIDTDELGNFYVFQIVGNDLKIDIFTSAFLVLPSALIDLSQIGLQKNNWFFSSVVVTKPFQFFMKFDSLENYTKSVFLSFDYNTKSLSKKYEVILPKENFVMISYLKNGFIACASSKNDLPVVMFLDPYDVSFKISHELYLDFQHPIAMRGFKFSKDGRLVVSFVDLLDNKIIFYYWDLISVK